MLCYKTKIIVPVYYGKRRFIICINKNFWWLNLFLKPFKLVAIQTTSGLFNKINFLLIVGSPIVTITMVLVVMIFLQPFGNTIILP